MNNFIRKSFTPRRTAYFLFGFLLVVTLLSLTVNRGLYYAYYHKSIELTLTGEVPAELWSELRTFTGVSKFDATEKTIRLQGVTSAEVNNFVNYIEQKGSEQSPISVSVAETQTWIPSDVILRAIWVSILLVGVSVIYLYFTVWRKLLKINHKLIAKLIAIYMLGLGLSVFLMLGILSLSSRVYEVTEISTLTILVTFVCGISFVYLSSRMVNADLISKHPRLSSLYLALSNDLAGLYKFVIAATTLVLVVVGFSLGVKFAFDGLLLWLSVGLSILSYSSINLVLVDGLEGRWQSGVIVFWSRLRRPKSRQKRKLAKQTITDKKGDLPKVTKPKSKKTVAVQRRRGR